MKAGFISLILFWSKRVRHGRHKCHQGSKKCGKNHQQAKWCLLHFLITEASFTNILSPLMSQSIVSTTVESRKCYAFILQINDPIWNNLGLCITTTLALTPRDSLKPAMHYSRTWRIGDEIIFSPNKILVAKTRRTCCCTLFVVRCQFSRGRFFLMKKYFEFVDETATPMQILRTAFAKHDERLLYIIRHTSFFHRFAPISMLFANSV